MAGAWSRGTELSYLLQPAIFDMRVQVAIQNIGKMQLLQKLDQEGHVIHVFMKKHRFARSQGNT